MKFFLIFATFLLLGIDTVRSESLDDAMTRFLAGEKVNPQDIDLPNLLSPAPESSGIVNDGSKYLTVVKLSILDPASHGGWPVRSPHVFTDARKQMKTYSELKAIYAKHKTPLVAYAMVCPAMYVDDMEILPELFAKIAENKPLKAQFDVMYPKVWKPRLDPDF